MFTPKVIAFLASCAILLAGCAGLSAPDDPRDDVAATAPDAPDRFDWLRTRTHIGAAVLETLDVEVQTMDDGALLLRLPAAEGFAHDSAEPTPALRTMLDHVAAVLADEPETGVEVLGHTDSLGSELYNLQLSIQRAEAVMDYLRGRGVPLGRLSADGRGEAEPIADNGHDDGRAINRRVEVIVRPFH